MDAEVSLPVHESYQARLRPFSEACANKMFSGFRSLTRRNMVEPATFTHRQFRIFLDFKLSTCFDIDCFKRLNFGICTSDALQAVLSDASNRWPVHDPMTMDVSYGFQEAAHGCFRLRPMEFHMQFHVIQSGRAQQCSGASTSG